MVHLVGHLGVEPNSTGYEPDAFTDKLEALIGATGRNRTGTTCGRQILSLLRLPIPPPEH